VVPDRDAAIEAWVRTLGAGPFFVMDRFENPRRRPNGGKAYTVANVALGQCGKVQIELVQSLGGRDDIYDLVDPGPSGALHHVAMFADDIDEAIAAYEAKGFAWWGRSGAEGAATTAFIDTRKTLGFFVELYQSGRGVEKVYERIAAAAVGWDGRNPIRPYAELMG
jgi:hypothetical protein